LDGIVAAHSGEPLQSMIAAIADRFGNLQTTTRKTIGENATPIITHNFCDASSWWPSSLRAVHDNLDNYSGDGITWRSDHKHWIDLQHGRVGREDHIFDNPIHANGPFTVVIECSDDGGANWVTLVMGRDYVVNYEYGEICTSWHNPYDPTFTQMMGVGSLAGKQVRASYNYAASGAGSSRWSVYPNPGKILIIDKTEVQFTLDALITCPIDFQPMMNHPLVGWIPIPGHGRTFKSASDYISEGNQGTGYIPAWGGGARYQGMMDYGVRHNVGVFPFDYVSGLTIPSSLGARLDISLRIDVPFRGEFANACLYTTEIDDPDWTG